MTDGPSAPQAAPKDDAAARRRRVKIRRRIGIPLASVAFLLAAAYLVLTTPLQAVPYEDPVDRGLVAANTVITMALVGEGITDPFVDTTRERVYVAYDLPAVALVADVRNETLAARYQAFVVGAAAEGAPFAEHIVVVQQVAGSPVESWSVGSSAVRDLLAGTIDEGMFRARVAVATY